jgi:hypothetical protein
MSPHLVVLWVFVKNEMPVRCVGKDARRSFQELTVCAWKAGLERLTKSSNVAFCNCSTHRVRMCLLFQVVHAANLKSSDAAKLWKAVVISPILMPHDPHRVRLSPYGRAGVINLEILSECPCLPCHHVFAILKRQHNRLRPPCQLLRLWSCRRLHTLNHPTT